MLPRRFPNKEEATVPMVVDALMGLLKDANIDENRAMEITNELWDMGDVNDVISKLKDLQDSLKSEYEDSKEREQ
jgi:type II secretory pathway component PulK